MSMHLTPPAPSPDALSSTIETLRGRRMLVLTGAGVSTDSGIPDYRGEGAPRRNPMTFDRFLESAEARRRYWVGSHLGWRAFNAAAPNAGHRAIAQLERGGAACGVVTQNVDGLHLQAGSSRVVELHGTMRRVLCLRCRQVFDRRDIGGRIEAENPWITVPAEAQLGPDGDVEPVTSDRFIVPACSVCGGMLKPEVVFFGEYIPVARFRDAERLLAASDALLVVGTSLVVNSGLRLIQRAVRRKLPIVIVNRGATKADDRATIKIDDGTTETLTALAAALTPHAIGDDDE